MSLSKHGSSSSSSSSAAIVFNEDLMTIIFLQLPVKSILKCKCVCKKWQSIASNPQFCHQHAALRGPNPNPSALIFQRNFDNTSDFEFCSLTGNSNTNTTRIVSFDYLNSPENGNLTLVSSCNGLFLFQSWKMPDFRKFYVCNPTTKKFIELALPLPDWVSKLQHFDANLAFDPCVSPHYKVVFMWRGSNNSQRITIYSSETKTWRKLLALNQKFVPILQGSGIFCNGKIHWHVDYGEESLYFDVEKVCLNVLPLPPWQRLCQPIRCFGESRGRMHAILCGGGPYIEDARTFVYELKEDYSGWVVKHQIGFGIENLMVWYFREEQDEGSTLLQLDGAGKIVAYNLKEKTTKKVCDLSPSSNESHQQYYRFNQLYENYQWCSGTYQWIETLSCV